MNQCQDCHGFVPAALQTCPHCEPGRPGLSKGLKRASQLVLGASITLTLSACYGVPPSSLEPCDDSIPDQGSCQIVPSPTPTPSESPAADSTTSDS